jgi:RNA polymerase-interacting CarD/CdnL/TRCF family regulator
MTMYPIGSKVVHPFYGAGTISRIQEKHIGERKNSYYVIVTVSKTMELLVPVHGAKSLGLRTVGDEEGLRRTLEDCSAAPEWPVDKDLQQRQAAMREGLKSGDYERVAAVVCQLYLMSAQRTLGTVDRQLFDQGKDLLSSELAAASGLELVEARQEVEDCLATMATDDL